MSKTIPAGSLGTFDVGAEVSIPLSNGASVQDEMIAVLHTSIRMREESTTSWWQKPVTLVKFARVMPAFDPNRLISKELEGFFEVAPGIDVVVSASIHIRQEEL